MYSHCYIRNRKHSSSSTNRTKLVLVAVAIVVAFGIAAATVGSTTIATPALAQNMTAGDNMTMGAAGNMTVGNLTGSSGGGGNWTK